MRYVALAVDYDGTLAHHGKVADESFEALERLRKSGRQVVLVTGRHLDDLKEVLEDRLELFDRVVAENGGLLYTPATRQERPLAPAPPEGFVKALRRRGVDPLSPGRVVVATSEGNEEMVLDVIHEQGLELQIVFNKGSVMVLPSGVNKRTGLKAALDDLKLSYHNVVGVGDAENDHALLRACEAAVAVANALPGLKQAADLVTDGVNGEGVRGVIAELLDEDLRGLEPRLERHCVLFGHTRRKNKRGKKVLLPPYGTGLLVVGSSKAGKSSLTLGILERLTDAGYQFCLIDPEGDYEDLTGAVNLGDADRIPTNEEVLDVLDRPDQSVVVSLLGVSAEDRPAYLAGLLPELSALRARTGRPHWLIADEAHHVLPSEMGPAAAVVPPDVGGLAMITLRASVIAPAALALTNSLCCVGQDPKERIEEYCRLLDEPLPRLPKVPAFLDKGVGLFWQRGRKKAHLVDIEPSKGDRKRHRRKYAAGELAPDLSFYFRGPEGRLNIRAQNLQIFMQIADGVDDETWLHHLRAGDYSRWVLEVLRDKKLAGDIRKVEEKHPDSAEKSREKVRAAIEKRYAPAGV